MLIDIHDVRILSQFFLVWQSLPTPTRQYLYDKISVISDDAKWIPVDPRELEQKKDSGVFGLAFKEYDRRADDYRIVFFNRVLNLEDAGLRGTIAHELAHVHLDDSRLKLEITEMMLKGEKIEPWIPEVMSECQYYDEFFWWLDDMIEYEASEQVQKWGFDILKPGHVLAMLNCFLEGTTGEHEPFHANSAVNIH